MAMACVGAGAERFGIEDLLQVTQVNDSRRTQAQTVDSSGKRAAVIVLGMHRSGTSAMSGVLHHLGAGLPAHLDQPNSFNERGYWESHRIQRFNDRLLGAAGSDWKDWSAFEIERLEPKTSEWEAELADLIREEFGESSLFVLKDPRFCRVAPLLFAALDRLGIASKIVVTVRNPLESARSLLHRDQMTQEDALLLWLRQLLDAERASRSYPRCFVLFDDLLADWRHVAERLERSLGLTWPNRSTEAERRTDEFLSDELRHHTARDKDLGKLGTVGDWIVAVYEVLLALATGSELTGAQADTLDDIRRRFNGTTSIFRSGIHARDELINKLRGEAETVRGSIADLETRLRDVEQSAERHRKDAESQRASSEKYKGEAQRYRDESERYREQAENYRSKLETAQLDLSLQKRENEELRGHLSAAERRTTRELVRARVDLHKLRRRRGGQFKLWHRAISKIGLVARNREATRADLVRASGLFDEKWYLTRYPDVAKAGMDPVIHYLRHGAREGRDPSPEFSTTAYLRRHLDVAAVGISPLLHFLEYGLAEERLIEPAASLAADVDQPAAELAERPVVGTGVTSEHRRFTQRGLGYEEFDPSILGDEAPDVKLLAFYLPQFHAIPENDRFWGKGFTEWRQVVRGLPRFPGHYQPRVPSDLGFYDLTDPDVMRRQIALAQAAGIYGFGFYYYWFDTRRVLEQPVETFLASPDLDMPFMAIWANENWTRTWDGMSGEILLHQSYDPQHEQALLADLARHFKDPRYIRFGDRPFFVIYQPRHVPDARETFARWRARWKSELGVEPVIFMAQTFGVEDPREFGLDGAIEFPPHKLTNMLPGRPAPDAFEPGFSGRIVRYDDVSAISLAEATPAYPLIKTVVPGWDNDARRPMRGTTIEGSTPRKYQRWLSALVKHARAEPVLGERIVAINAWNEWAEGAYLEPDVHYGAAYLNATARALIASSESELRPSSSGIVLVGHDALDFGAQRLLLSIGTTLVRSFGVSVRYVLLEDGPLLPRYQEIGPCFVVSPDRHSQVQETFERLATEGFASAIANTTVTGKVVEAIKTAGFHIVSLIHELPGIIRDYGLASSVAAISRVSDVVVFAGEHVHDSFRQLGGCIAGRAIVKPQGLYRGEIAPDPTAPARIRAELCLPPDAKIVLNVGYGDLRKGYDLFGRTAKLVAQSRSDVFFVWVGKLPRGAGGADAEAAAAAPENRKVLAVGHREDVAAFYAAADVLFLSSREDPYPSVVLEAMAAGLSVIGFAGATGCEELIATHGKIVPFENLGAAADAIGALLDIPLSQRRASADARIAEIRANYDFGEYCFWLMRQFDPALRRVSVLVPNFNHEHYLKDRLESIFKQSYPVCQVVVLDDASSDGSIAEIRKTAAEGRRDILLMLNGANSGSLVRQWMKGLAQCTGDFLWIAESDDVSDPRFLAETVAMLDESGADFCFTDSWQIDAENKRTGESYIGYIDDIAAGTFTQSFAMEGREFLRRFLSIKNVILNMSGVLWRREAFVQALNAAAADLRDLRVAGDWRLYMAACAAGQRVAYVAKSLNGHRRHERSITSSLEKQRHADEVQRLQGLAAQQVELDEAARQRAAEHLAHVYRYLGLSNPPISGSTDAR